MKSQKKIHVENITEESIDEFIKNEFNNKISIKITNLLCYLSNYITLVPTLMYNTIWFFKFKYVIENIGGEIMPLDLENNIQGCTDLYHWVNYCITMTLFSFFKGLFLLGLSKLCCGEENDCNICCLIFKGITSLVPSIIIVIEIPDLIKKYKAISIINSSMNLKSKCDDLAVNLYAYYNWEYAYMLIITIIFCSIPAGAILMCIKEIWKSRGYNEDKNDKFK